MLALISISDTTDVEKDLLTSYNHTMGGAGDIPPSPPTINIGLPERSQEPYGLDWRGHAYSAKPDLMADMSGGHSGSRNRSTEGTRLVMLKSRLYDPDSDFPGTPSVDEDYSSMRADELTTAHRPYSLTKREPKREEVSVRVMANISRRSSPPLRPRRTPVGRESRQIVILKRGNEHSGPPQQPQMHLGEGEDIRMVAQPEIRPISAEQLMAEVKGIYAGLVMVEAKCQEVDAKQTAACQDGHQPKLNNEQWQALIALHRNLLHERHDFFLASQHPSASPSVRRLAAKYATDGSWGGQSDVHETKKGTSHTTRALHQLDPPAPLSLSSSARKRTFSDSSPAESPAAPDPHDVPRDDQSPKRSRRRPASPPRRGSGPVRGSLASGT